MESDSLLTDWENSDFRFVDIDNDGDWDVFVNVDPKKQDESIGWTIKYYENTGTPNAPVFEERTDTAHPLAQIGVRTSYTDIAPEAMLIFVDIDADQDFDVFFGNQLNNAVSIL